MKTTCSFLGLLIPSLSALSQGIVNYQNTAGAGKEKYVYGVDAANPTSDVLGGTRDKVAGSGYYAQLYWASMAAGEPALQPIEASLTTFKSGTTAGLINGNSKLAIPGTYGGDRVILQLRVWDNLGGTIASWAEVVKHPELAYAKSNLVLNYELSGSDVNNVPHVGSGNLAAAGLQSFGLYPLPEPSVIGMSALGVAALLFSRRSLITDH